MYKARWTSILSIVLVAGCTASVTPAPSPTPVPTPSPSPAGFTLDVLPAETPIENRLAIPGSKYCFLVKVTDATGGSDPVTIAATAVKAKVVDIVPSALKPGVVGEVWVAADPTTDEARGSVTITASRGAVVQTATRTLGVFPMKDERAADARPYFDSWAAWLATAHPELGITAATAWEPIFASTLIVVSHYSYWSTDWEVTVAWHNMIAPYDWTDVFLRRRGTDMTPSLAFRMDSVSGKTAPHAIEPPTDLVR